MVGTFKGKQKIGKECLEDKKTSKNHSREYVYPTVTKNHGHFRHHRNKNKITVLKTALFAVENKLK